MASVSVKGPPELLDCLTDDIGAERDLTLRRLALDQLEAIVEDSAEFSVRVRVEAKLAKFDGTKSARLE